MTASQTRDPQWELMNSWWVLTTLPLVTGWLGFIYIGVKVSQRKWIAWAFIYMIPAVLLLFFVGAGGESGSVAGTRTFLGVLIIAIGAFSICHALTIRRDYLEKLSDLESGKPPEPGDGDVRRELRISYVPGKPPRGQSPGQPPEQSIPADPSLASTTASSIPIEECDPVHVIDINTVSEEILSAIPEIGPELAPKVIVERMNRQGFGSIEELAEAFHFSKYQLEVLAPLVYFSKPKLPEAPDTPGRLVDY
jgi:Helix-hairpin-helix motif